MNCVNHPDREHTAFCQNCGKPICQECTRVVGSAVYCEPCPAAKLSGAGAPPPAAGPYPSPRTPPNVNYPAPASIPPPPVPPDPNPPPPAPAPTHPPPPNASWGVPGDSYAPPVPPVPPSGTASYPGYPVDPNLAPLTRNRFPVGAIWLIGLGCVFLIGNAGLFHTFPIHRIVPFFLIGFGVWLFVRKMNDTGAGLADDGTPGYQFRLFRALRGSVWVTLIGVLFLLDSFDILSWGRSWPVIIIVAGLMAIFQRISYSSAMAVPYPY